MAGFLWGSMAARVAGEKHFPTGSTTLRLMVT